MKEFILYLIFFLINVSSLTAQSIDQSVPDSIDPEDTYLFYLHGGIIEAQGVNAVSKYYGAYKYLDILDTLSRHNFRVISEARPKGTDVKKYAAKVAGQVDTLLQAGVPQENIVILGASLGAYIAFEAAILIKNPGIRYAVLGLCSDYAVNYFSDYSDVLIGNFLSIYEHSDSKSSCQKIFENPSEDTLFKEIELNMGIDHSFLYKPYDEWVIPLVEWAHER